MARPRPQRLNRAESRERNRRMLLESAVEVLIEHGVGDAMLDDVAAGAGLTKGAIYSIFGSKRELIVALLRHQFVSTTPTLDPLEEALSLEDALREHARTHVAQLLEREMQRQVSLELELAALGLRDADILEAISRERHQRRERLAGELVGRRTSAGTVVSEDAAARIAAALLALEQGASLHLALDRDGTPSPAADEAALVEAAAAFATLADIEPQ